MVARISAYVFYSTMLDIARFSGHVSVSGSQITAFRTTFVLLTVMGGIWLTAIGAILYAIDAFQHGGGAGEAVADGSILMTVLALALIINVAIVAPGLLMLQPFRLWRVVRNERRAITPRQRFRGRLSRSFYKPIIFLYSVHLSLHLLFVFSLTARAGRAAPKWIPFLITSFFDSRLSWGIRPCVRYVVLYPRHHLRLSVRADPSIGRSSCDPVVAPHTSWWVFRFSSFQF